MARIFIVDDHAHVRRQLRLMIESQNGWEVCAEAIDGNEAVDRHATVDPHVTVMDFNMPGMDGLKASRRILADNPEAAILMVTVFVSQHLANEARRAGIKGVCSKSGSACIIEGIQTLLRGETYSR